MNDRDSILYNALGFIAHHVEGDHGVESFRKYARDALIRYYRAAERGEEQPVSQPLDLDEAGQWAYGAIGKGPDIVRALLAEVERLRAENERLSDGLSKIVRSSPLQRMAIDAAAAVSHIEETPHP